MSMKDNYKNILSTLFLIAPNWKQPKCLLTVEWTNKVWHVLLCSNVKNYFCVQHGCISKDVTFSNKKITYYRISFM